MSWEFAATRRSESVEADYVGRDWLDERMDAYLGARESAQGTPLLIVAGPGVGKTAYLRHLVRERGHPHHFCSRTHPLSQEPGRFARSLGRQLADLFPERYPQVLAQQHGVHITSSQTVGTMLGGQAVGVYINYLSAADPYQLFVQLVVDPLTELLADDGRVLPILIDGLDEVVGHGRRISILDLLAMAVDLPPTVRVIATTRPDAEVRRYFPHAAVFDLRDAESHLRSDARRYIARRIDSAPLRERLDRSGVDPTDLARVVERRSQNNFLYLRLLLDGLENGTYPPTSLDSVPEGLDAVYTRSLDALIDRLGADSWRGGARAFMGIMCVAGEPLGFRQIARFAGLSATAIQDMLIAFQPLLAQTRTEPDDPRDGETAQYSLFHISLADILQDRDRAPRHWIDSAEFHGRIVRACMSDDARVPWESQSDYVLRRLSSHMAKAGEPYTDDLIALLDSDFRTAKIRRFHSDRSFLDDVDTAMAQLESRGLAGLPAALSLSLMHATLLEHTSFVSVPALVELARVAKDEALTRLQDAGTTEAVVGIFSVASALASDDRIDEAVPVLRLAVQRTLELHGEARTTAMAGLIEEMGNETATEWLEPSLEPIVMAVRDIDDEDTRLSLFTEIAAVAARSVGDAAAPLLREAGAIADSVEPAAATGSRLKLASVWSSLGRPDLALHQRRAVSSRLTDVDLTDFEQDIAVALASTGEIGAALSLADELGHEMEFDALAGALETGASVDRAWRAADTFENHENRVALSIALCQRLADLGQYDDALTRLRSLDAFPGSVWTEELLTAAYARVADIVKDDRPDDARRLVEDAIQRIRTKVDGSIAAGHLAFMDDRLETSLLSIATIGASIHGDRQWSRTVIEKVRDLLLQLQPIKLVFISGPVRRTAALVGVAKAMALAGDQDRAVELLTEALGHARAAPLGWRGDAFGLVAGGLRSIENRQWAHDILRGLLDDVLLPAMGTEVSALVGLASAIVDGPDGHATLVDLIGAIERRIEELNAASKQPGEDDDHAEVLDAVAELSSLLPRLQDRGLATDVWRRLWSMTSELDQNADRAGALAALVEAWYWLGERTIPAPVDGMVSGLDRAVAWARLARLHENDRDPDGVESAIGQGLREAAPLDWSEGFRDALDAVVTAIPEHPGTSRWLEDALRATWSRDWRSTSADNEDIDRWNAVVGRLADGPLATDPPGGTARDRAVRTVSGLYAGEAGSDDALDGDLRWIFDEVELDESRAHLHGLLALNGAMFDQPDVLHASTTWLSAAERWAALLNGLLVRAGLADDWFDLASSVRTLLTTVHEELDGVVEELVQRGESAAAEELITSVYARDGSAYLWAGLSNAHAVRGDDRAARTCADRAVSALGTPSNDTWPPTLTAVASALLRTGRRGEALALVNEAGSPTARNDVRDALAYTLAADRAPDAALRLVESMEPFDPWSLHDGLYHAHVAIEAIVDAYLSQGDDEAALRALGATDDPWAMYAHRAAQRSLCRRIVDLAGTDANRESAVVLAYGVLAQARAGGRAEVLQAISHLAPVLVAIGPNALSDCWARIRASWYMQIRAVAR